MHELSIASNIVEIAAEVAEREGAGSVGRIHLTLGPLAGVVREALEFAFPLACEGTSCEGAELCITELPLLLHCAACRRLVLAAGPYSFRCPVCATPTADVRQGRELEITSIEIEEEE